MISGLSLVLTFFIAISQTQAGVPAKNLFGRPLEPSEAESVIRKLNGLQKNIDAISANVRQTKTIPLLDEKVTSEGTIILKKPNLLRWEIQTPEKMVIVVDGKSMWVYRPEVGEASRRSFDSDIALRHTVGFFSSALGLSLHDLEKRFSVNLYKTDNGTVMALMPRSKMLARYLKKILIWYEESDGTPGKFYVEGKKGDLTVTELREVKINPAISADTFDFVPPKGVVIKGVDEDDNY